MVQPQHPDDDASGFQVRTVGAGRYELGRRLGRGGMAEVCMARDVRLGRTVAIKTLRPDLAQDAVARSRFGREAQNAASLNHPAIVSVYDTGEDRVGDELVPFIVMECVEGRTVRELLADGNPIPQEQALRITEGVLEALEYSHRNGIIHRDIKPANVIITNAGAVKVMDFGIARAMHSAATTMTQTGMVMGTPQYLSPEQALGRTVDARSDLYSCGCLLYELLALRPPFNGDTPLSVVYQHVQDDPRPPSEFVPGVPEHLDSIALKALAKDPEERYQSADEMRMDIRRALAGQPVKVMRPQRSAPPPPGYTRNTAVLGQGAVGATQNLRASSPDDGTAQLPRFGGPGGPATPPPAGGARVNDGGTGAMPVVEPQRQAKRRRPLKAAVVVAIVLAAVGGGVLALADDKEKPSGRTPVSNPSGVKTSKGSTEDPQDPTPGMGQPGSVLTPPPATGRSPGRASQSPTSMPTHTTTATVTTTATATATSAPTGGQSTPTKTPTSDAPPPTSPDASGPG